MAQLFTEAENRLLTQTGPGTPMGELMRRYWIPAFLSERLPMENSDPFEITLLGESLVAFRGRNGQVGLMDSKCPHRRASLVLARVEDDCALRCIYHGWKVDAQGRVLETPPEPPNSRFAQSIKHRAYPTREAGGIVWTYMGPEKERPEFPMWPFNGLPKGHVWANHFYQPSNWLQGLEGDLDAAHGGYLHYSKEEWDRQRNSNSRLGKFLFDPRPQTAVEPAPWGLQTAFRYHLEEEKEAVFWIHPLISPFYTMFSHAEDGAQGGLFHAWVPSTDGSHYVYSVVWQCESPLTEDRRQAIDATQGYTAVDKANGYLSVNWDGKGYRQDRERMTEGLSFSGFEGVHLQDLAIQHSMGPVVERSKENLCAEDFLIIQARRFFLETLEKLARSEELPALQPGMDYSRIEHRWVFAPSSTSLAEVLARKDWDSSAEENTRDVSTVKAAWSALGAGGAD
ncbi:Rieske 2Fe-2S domain-containing protein [Microtetraspora sp. NBRC 16547]|uniref:Rieske 2Fe-2S domain-containing protein n=1 Tax=Microtetraspora sp. NBRC 16547 TaxID=3030993 RepID=UPI0024A06870|nr:Rieske 2Fe-2S domain-containing protein [Microtetraspora sp. NBRC 16547]GLW99441.1 ring-hydroxylating oxygenase subunit alpha [Microtetraspora sp. NBRC 16547]